jgi:hypothetical protein
MNTEKPRPPNEQFIEVSISTTSGFYPADGFERAPVHQKVTVLLGKAQRELKIKDTAGWIATVTEPSGKRQISPDRSYLDNGLADRAEIDWGPSEGGGG